MIEETIEKLWLQLGIRFELCDHFAGVRTHNSEKFFNVLIEDKSDLVQLQRYANTYGTIRVEPNGIKRIAIFPIEKKAATYVPDS